MVRHDLKIPHSNFGSLAEPDDASDIFRPRPHPVLLMTATKQRRNLNAFADEKCADALWSVKLVRRKSQQIHAQLLNINGNFRYGLNGIGVHQNIGTL